jgi:hypothetical protein
MTSDRLDTLSTYRHLRLAMALLLGLLLVAVALRALSAPGVCFEGSISAYYFTSARAVFVTALCALGTCLIVYRGNTDAEDIALNASGALAFVVAFVPTGAPNTTGVTCSASNVPSPGQLEDAVNNNMVALIVVSVAALVVAITLVARSTRLGKAPLRALVAFAVVLGVCTASFARWPAGFRANAHTTAAIGTFLGILAVVGLNALGAERAREGGASPVRYRNAYGVIALAMLASAVIIGAAHWRVSGWRHGVLLIEATLLVEFMVFWLVQTVELWHRTRREAPVVLTPSQAT